MATTSIPTDSLADSLTLYRFSSAKYLQMVETGVLGPRDRVELIGGTVVDMSPSGARHNHILTRFNRLLVPLWSECEILIQGTLELSEGQVFDPDVMLVRQKPGGYRDHLPTAADVLLVIEAAESSLQRDQSVKLPYYADAGIAEYWIADLKQETLLVHRQPQGSQYASVETLGKDATVSPLAAPSFSLKLAEVFN